MGLYLTLLWRRPLSYRNHCFYIITTPNMKVLIKWVREYNKKFAIPQLVNTCSIQVWIDFWLSNVRVLLPSTNVPLVCFLMFSGGIEVKIGWKCVKLSISACHVEFEFFFSSFITNIFEPYRNISCTTNQLRLSEFRKSKNEIMQHP